MGRKMLMVEMVRLMITMEDGVGGDGRGWQVMVLMMVLLETNDVEDGVGGGS